LAPSSSFNAAAFSSPSHPRQTSGNSSSLMQPLQPRGAEGFAKQGPSAPSLQQQIQKPNYNIALPTISPAPISPPITPMTHTPAQPSFGRNLSPPLASISSPMFAAQPAMGSLLAPSKPAQQPWNATKKSTNNDWGDFDPLA
jgi:SCY1-like protein 2